MLGLDNNIFDDCVTSTSWRGIPTPASLIFELERRNNSGCEPDVTSCRAGARGSGCPDPTPLKFENCDVEVDPEPP